ncbi:hypothetical protein [Fulvivirga ligni]|uniref:hypothetical protein n=1 Tax=Fulvivirga ligni TaxID=2904246 RepID=UPI001F47BAF3|nr:hypothetical protein [Fulvivirga ligni]UII23366.1 hypothetical protein LVD16_09015 [Fulvivirga ligni]
MKKSVKVISLFLGVSMFMFGVLKFIDPFKSWYTVQVQSSELPFPSYWAGQLGEIFSGILFLLLVTRFHSLPAKAFKILFLMDNLLVIIMMVVAFYVHLHPNVPQDVLPLKFRPPVIPAVFLILAVINLVLN